MSTALSSFFGWLLRTSWQASILTVIVLAVQWAFQKKLSARWRHALWFLVLARLALPTSTPSPISLFNYARIDRVVAETSSKSLTPPADRETAYEQPQDMDAKIQPSQAPTANTGQSKTNGFRTENTPRWCALVWLVGALCFAVRILGQNLMFFRRLGPLREVTDPQVLALFTTCKADLGVTRTIRLSETHILKSPALYGFVRQRLLLPAGLISQFSATELRHIFMHELAHVKRHDMVVLCLATLGKIIHWFNPVLWFGLRQMAADRELACDEVVLSYEGEGESGRYGETILKLLELCATPAAAPGLMGILEDKNQMHRRISLIARFKQGSRRSVLAVLLVVALGLVTLTDAQPQKHNSVFSQGTSMERVANENDELPRVLDLNPYYTWRFVSAKGTNKSFQSIHGRQVIDGLPFDIDGQCVLYGRSEAHWWESQGKTYPDEITGIEIGRKFAELHLIHTAWWHEFHGCPIATIRLHYSDGDTVGFQLRYCVHVLANRLPTEERETLTDPHSKLIWLGPGSWNDSSRLVETVLQNPFPGKIVESMDVISTRSRTSYALVAATVANADRHRKMTSAVPLNRPGRRFDGSLKLRVLDKETGEPIAGVDVYPNMMMDGVGLVADPMLTSNSGEAIVKYPIARTRSLGVEMTKPGYQSESASWPDVSIPNAITYRLKKNAMP
jgi:beta-lactamase regulating signal transducer with metallopeptidase domain